MKVNGSDISWTVFRTEFLEKCFLADVHSKKEIEFLELKQGNLSIADYVGKF